MGRRSVIVPDLFLGLGILVLIFTELLIALFIFYPSSFHGPACARPHDLFDPTPKEVL